MVLSNQFEDLLHSSVIDLNLTLPGYKQNCLKLEYPSDNVCESDCKNQDILLPFATSSVFYSTIASWRKLTADSIDCKPVYEVSFDVKDSNFKYKAGDTIGIIPHNNIKEVNAVVYHLNLSSQVNLNYHLSIDSGQKGGKIPAHIPEKSTLMHVLTYCLDLRSIVKKLFLLALSQHTKDEKEKKIMEYFCSREGSTAYNTHILDKNICILDIFSIFTSCKPPVEVLLSNLPRLLPRPYSIINNSQKAPSILKICFSVMDIGNNRRGLTTSWLEEIILNERQSLERRLENLSFKDMDSKVPIYLRKNMSGFSMPDNFNSLILIGPGTGVSPFIGFLEERKICLDDSKERGYVWLFFGCRNPQLDFIYEKELNDYLSNGSLNKLTTAFSRIENNGIKYVQDAILQNGKEITTLIEKGASIFICGDLKLMATQVRESLETCLIQFSGKTLEEAKTFISVMAKEKRYVVDVWS